MKGNILKKLINAELDEPVEDTPQTPEEVEELEEATEELEDETEQAEDDVEEAGDNADELDDLHAETQAQMKIIRRYGLTKALALAMDSTGILRAQGIFPSIEELQTTLPEDETAEDPAAAPEEVEPVEGDAPAEGTEEPTEGEGTTEEFGDTEGDAPAEGTEEPTEGDVEPDGDEDDTDLTETFDEPTARAYESLKTFAKDVWNKLVAWWKAFVVACKNLYDKIVELFVNYRKMAFATVQGLNKIDEVNVAAFEKSYANTKHLVYDGSEMIVNKDITASIRAALTKLEVPETITEEVATSKINALKTTVESFKNFGGIKGFEAEVKDGVLVVTAETVKQTVEYEKSKREYKSLSSKALIADAKKAALDAKSKFANIDKIKVSLGTLDNVSKKALKSAEKGATGDAKAKENYLKSVRNAVAFYNKVVSIYIKVLMTSGKADLSFARAVLKAGKTTPEK